MVSVREILHVAALSLRRLSGENLLPFILVGDFFDSEKRVYRVVHGSKLSFLAKIKATASQAQNIFQLFSTEKRQYKVAL